jgi:hypothetical protein
MDTRPWHKMETTRQLSLMQRHSNENIGRWFRVWCTLADSNPRWTYTATLPTWARIIGDTEQKTKAFIKYLDSHVVDIRVVYTLGEDRKRRFTITEEYKSMLEDKSAATTGRKPQKGSKTPLVLKREEFKEKLIAAYHQSRVHLQRPTFEKYFDRVMLDASRSFAKMHDREVAESNKFDVIMAYIEFLKTTDEWIEGGVHLPGIGHFVKERRWETDARFLKNRQPEGTSEKDELLAKIEGDRINGSDF